MLGDLVNAVQSLAVVKFLAAGLKESIVKKTNLKTSRSARPTLDDVARVAGVSRATVDRVLNERGQVRDATATRVRNALNRIEYFPEQVSAVSALRGAPLTFDFLMPDAPTGYFRSFADCIKEYSEEWRHFGLTVRSHLIEGLESEAFAEKMSELSGNSDGVALVAMDVPTIRQAIDDMTHQMIPVVTLVTDVSNTTRTGYVGIDNRAAGRTAGLFMGRFLNPKEKHRVAVFLGSHLYRGHEERLAGFSGIIRERFPNIAISTQNELFDSDERSFDIAEKLLQKEGELSGIYNIGGCTIPIAKALDASDRTNDVVLMGHELQRDTRRFLTRGVIDVIINQDIRQEIISAIQMLLNEHENKETMWKVSMPKVEVYCSENVF